DARTLIFRLRECHDRDNPNWRPHQQLMDFAGARLAKVDLAASLNYGWVLARAATIDGAASPITPMTRIAPSTRAVEPIRIAPSDAPAAIPIPVPPADSARQSPLPDSTPTPIAVPAVIASSAPNDERAEPDAKPASSMADQKAPSSLVAKARAKPGTPVNRL